MAVFRRHVFPVTLNRQVTMAQTVRNATAPVIGIHHGITLVVAMEIVPPINMLLVQTAILAATIPLTPVGNVTTATTRVTKKMLID